MFTKSFPITVCGGHKLFSGLHLMAVFHTFQVDGVGQILYKGGRGIGLRKEHDDV
jgi:hypothetical protein